MICGVESCQEKQWQIHNNHGCIQRNGYSIGGRAPFISMKIAQWSMNPKKSLTSWYTLLHLCKCASVSFRHASQLCLLLILNPIPRKKNTVHHVTEAVVINTRLGHSVKLASKHRALPASRSYYTSIIISLQRFLCTMVGQQMGAYGAWRGFYWFLVANKQGDAT